eukprot:7639948-Pyramimonas_sp.AAC.1
MAKKGTLTLKKAAPVRKAAPVKKAAPAKKAAPRPRPAKKAQGPELWFPGAVAPEWLDGSMVGDRGFDPFGLAKPAEYLQFELDALDQNTDNNPAGAVLGRLIPDSTTVSDDSLQVSMPMAPS